MRDEMPESTAAMLEAFRADFQRQLNGSARLDRLVMQEGFGLVSLVAVVRIGGRTVELTGAGENVLTAYADLTRSAPEPILAHAFREVLGT